MNDDNARVDRYLSGDMDAPERQAFEAEMAADSQLAEEVALRRDMEVFLRRREHRSALQAQLSQMGGGYFKAEKQEAKVTTLPRRRLLWIGAVAAAAGLALFLLRPQLFGPSLFEQYAQYPQLALAEKSAGGPIDWSRAETAFNSRDFSTAEKLLGEYVAGYPADRQALLYLGICRMEMGKSEEARQIFRDLAAADAAFKDYADWYLALSYLKAGDKAACREALVNIPAASVFYEQAQKLLKQI